MKIIVFILFPQLLFSVCASAQKKDSSSSRQAEEQIFIKVEPEAGFPGGDLKLVQFVEKRFNLSLLTDALPDSVHSFTDSVFVKLIVKKDGQLKGFETAGGFSPFFGKEACRVLELSAPWKPYMAGGLCVSAYKYYVFTFNMMADMANINMRESNSTSFLNAKRRNP